MKVVVVSNNLSDSIKSTENDIQNYINEWTDDSKAIDLFNSFVPQIEYKILSDIDILKAKYQSCENVETKKSIQKDILKLTKQLNSQEYKDYKSMSKLMEKSYKDTLSKIEFFKKEYIENGKINERPIEVNIEIDLISYCPNENIRKYINDKYKKYAYGNKVYIVDGECTDEERELLIMDSCDAERRKFERLKNKFSGNKQGEYVRVRISESVRIEVWRRDQGKCAQCGSRENLEYDHIVPVSKGGSNTARNVELLCEKCNRSKSDNIQ